jgi:uncharacterized protein (DUF2237 family)
MSTSAANPAYPLRSLEPGERWLWCYVDELAVE